MKQFLIQYKWVTYSGNKITGMLTKIVLVHAKTYDEAKLKILSQNADAGYFENLTIL